jgi:hypothetical protein
MPGAWGRVVGLRWVDQGGSNSAPLCHGHRRGNGSPDPGAVPPRSLVEEDAKPPVVWCAGPRCWAWSPMLGRTRERAAEKRPSTVWKS